jgi:hypothetical protein
MSISCRTEPIAGRRFPRGKKHEGLFSNQKRRPGGGLRSTDRLVDGCQEPPLGSHLVTPRRGFLHHGIYIGNRTVVHYAGLAHGLRRGPVEEVPITRFAGGQRIWVRSHCPSDFGTRDVVRRARSRVGEDCYRLWTNNCEHFCEWCLRGEARSLQVEAWRAQPGRALSMALRLIARACYERLSVSLSG